MTIFLDIASYSLMKVTDVLEMLAAFIIRVSRLHLYGLMVGVQSRSRRADPQWREK